MYVGKAKNLKNRISQYRQFAQLSALKQRLVSEAVEVRCEVRTSELEALFVEAELIRQYQPKYNVQLKDDKSPLYIVLTREMYPRVLTVRRSDLDTLKKRGRVFGPFSSGYMVQQVLRSIRPIFRWCAVAGERFPNRASLTAPRGARASRPCFYYHIERCSGACVGAIEPSDYQARMNRLTWFLRGKTTMVQRQLEREIRELSARRRFEEAEQLRLQWDAIRRVTAQEYRLSPDLAIPQTKHGEGEGAVAALAHALRDALQLGARWRPRRIECYDVSNVQGRYATVSMVVFVDGVQAKEQYRIFHILTKETPDDYAMLQEAIIRRQKHPEWGRPDLLVIDGGQGQLHAVQEVWRWLVPVVSLAKDPDRVFLPLPGGELRVVAASEWLSAGKLLGQLRDEAHRFAKKHVHLRLEKRDQER